MLSVVVCTYNGANYLRQQLDSLFAQTLMPDEIVLHDDGSTDGTLEIAEEYRQRAFRLSGLDFRIISNKGPHGVNGNFFGALSAARGEYIAICDQDDIWEPTKLDRQMQMMSPGVLLCGCISRPFSTDGSPVSTDDRPANLSPLRMMYVGMMPGHTLLIHRDILRYLPRGDFFMYDLQLQMVAALLGRLAYVPEVLVHQRRYPRATTYMAPQSRLQIFLTALRNYHQLRPRVRQRFAEWQRWLVAQDKAPISASPAVHRMVYLQQGRGVLNYLRLTAFCLKHRREILPTPALSGLRALLFGLAFPFTCVNYYRYFLE